MSEEFQKRKKKTYKSYVKGLERVIQVSTVRVMAGRDETTGIRERIG